MDGLQSDKRQSRTALGLTSNMNYAIRLATESDYRETEMITRESFWDVYKPGCDEHLILHKIRNVKAFVKELDLVVCERERIIGNIVYSKARIINEKNDRFEVLCMGPVCVLPDYQKKGIGSLLINESIELARELKHQGIVLMGNPDFYGKFGFKKASLFNIQTSAGKDFDYLLALELYEGSLNGISGRFYEDSVFQVEPNELVEFEKQFPFTHILHLADQQPPNKFGAESLS